MIFSILEGVYSDYLSATGKDGFADGSVGLHFLLQLPSLPSAHARQVKEKRPACGAQGGAILRFAQTMESQWQALRHHSLAFSWASAERSPPLHEFTVNLTRMPSAGRNHPCPCGSGRKFKKCCGWVSLDWSQNRHRLPVEILESKDRPSAWRSLKRPLR
jgi:hypothetical protein